MTWSSEGEPSASADAHVEFDGVRVGEPNRRRLWWWAPIVAGCLLAVGALWQRGDGGAPSAVVTPTNMTTTVDDTSNDTSTTSPLVTSPPVSEGSDTPTETRNSASGSSIPRPVVPASTTTAPRSAPTTLATPPTASFVVRTSTTIVVSADADADAPVVRVVDGGAIEAVVAEPVANSALDGADRSTSPETTPTSTSPPLACAEGAETQIDLADVGRVTAEAANGSPRTIATTDLGMGVAKGRDPVRIDYSAEHGASERLFVDLRGRYCSVVVAVGDLEAAEWDGHAESAHWVALGTDNRTVGEGWLLGGSDSAFTLPLSAPVERLLLEAAPYGATSAGWPPGADRVVDDNSDFVVVSITVR